MDIIKKKFLEELSLSNGIIKTACANAGIVRQTYYNWKKEDAEFASACEDITEDAIDYVESKLMEKVNGVTVRKGVDDETGEDITYDLPPSDTAIIFFLKCKAKKRGYVERTEIEHSGNRITLEIIRTTEATTPPEDTSQEPASSL